MNKPTVFVIDDDRAVASSLCWLIETVKLNVETFASAQEFLDGYDPSRPGCLVLDVRMPGMSGIELQEQLAAQRINIPIIFITGHGDVKMAVRCRPGLSTSSRNRSTTRIYWTAFRRRSPLTLGNVDGSCNTRGCGHASPD